MTNTQTTKLEFEAALTTRVLSKRMTAPATKGAMRERIDYREFVDWLEIETKSLIKSLRLDKQLKVKKSRNGRIFLISEKSGRISAEIGVDFEKARNKVKQPRAILVSKYKLPKTIQEF